MKKNIKTKVGIKILTPSGPIGNISLAQARDAVKALEKVKESKLNEPSLAEEFETYAAIIIDSIESMGMSDDLILAAKKDLMIFKMRLIELEKRK
jgi:hypothetical protein